MVIGTVGFGFFAYGKKQQRIPHLATGIVLMVYPYFVHSVAWSFVIGVALIALLFLATYLGL